MVAVFVALLHGWGQLHLAEAGGPPSPGTPEEDLFARINLSRLERGLSALVPDSRLRELAAQRSADMLNRNYFSHVIPGCDRQSNALGPLATAPAPCDFMALLDSQRVPYLAAGEVLEWNLYLTQFSQDQTDAMVIAELMRSPLHQQILLDVRFTNGSVGVAIGPDKRMIMTVLVTRSGG